MARRNQLVLFRDVGSPPDAPLVYIASSLTHLSGTDREVVMAWGDIIESAVHEATLESEDQWLLRVHLPAKISPPWTDRRPANAIYELNSDTLWAGTDAVILIGHKGGSCGAGQELEWAAAQGVPVLYVHSSNEAVSRQVEGNPCDLTVVAFQSPEELRDGVTTFLRLKRRVIQDGPRRRRSTALRFTPLAAQLLRAWTRLDERKQAEVAAVSRLTAATIARAVEAPAYVAAMPLARVAALAAALGVEFRAGTLPLPDLTFAQTRSLVAAEAEYEWGEAVANRLVSVARLELARGGVRRFRLATVEDWKRLHDEATRGN